MLKLHSLHLGEDDLDFPCLQSFFDSGDIDDAIEDDRFIRPEVFEGEYPWLKFIVDTECRILVWSGVLGECLVEEAFDEAEYGDRERGG